MDRQNCYILVSYSTKINNSDSELVEAWLKNSLQKSMNGMYQKKPS